MALPRTIEHTALKATTTPADVERLVDEALTHGFVGVCVSPLHVARAAARLAGRAVVVTVAAFPLGASHPEVSAAEARRAVDDGAGEVDLVVPIGRALAGDVDGVERTVATVRRAIGAARLKVILETAYFDVDAIRALAARAVAGGADFLKTSTGFGPRGATVEDVRLLAQEAPEGVGVKAAGGIRDRATALTMLEAGATRIGTSSGVAIMAPSS
ncbi:MAG: deoxyribose-phosphate aldolase [Sandaracinaceae bacterium]